MKLENWKESFTVGETIVLKGHGFYLAAVTRRGITFRKAKKSNQPKKEAKVEN